MDRVGQPNVEGIVVLDEGRLLVVEHQLLQGAIQVVGLCKAVAPRCAVDHTVLHLPIGAVETQPTNSREMKVSDSVRDQEIMPRWQNK